MTLKELANKIAWLLAHDRENGKLRVTQDSDGQEIGSLEIDDLTGSVLLVAKKPDPAEDLL